MKKTYFGPLWKWCHDFFYFFLDDYWSSTPYLQHSTHWKFILMKFIYFKILQCSPYYSFLEQIFNWFADFATDFGNGNIMTKTCPITKLKTSALKSALTVLKTFCSQINLHQATMTAITVMPGSVSAYRCGAHLRGSKSNALTSS